MALVSALSCFMAWLERPKMDADSFADSLVQSGFLSNVVVSVNIHTQTV